MTWLDKVAEAVMYLLAVACVIGAMVLLWGLQ